jgi:hypothetical protein
MPEAFQISCNILMGAFQYSVDDNALLGNIWFNVHSAISRAGDSRQKERLRNESEFKAYVTEPESNRKRELIDLVRSMVKQEVNWECLFQNGPLLSSL